MSSTKPDGPKGNTDPEARGLKLGPGGKVAPPGRKLSGQQGSKPAIELGTLPDGVDGTAIGGRR